MELYNKFLKNLTDIPTSISQELSDFYNHSVDVEACDCDKNLSGSVVEYLITQFRKQPYDVIQIIKETRQNYHVKHEKPFKDLFVDLIRKLVESSHEYNSEAIYSLLNNAETIPNDLLEEIHEMVSAEKVDMSFVYLSVLSNEKLLKMLIEYERKCLNSLDVTDQTSLFNYCLKNHIHWLFYFLENEICFELSKYSIVNKIWVLKLIHLSNKHDINLTDVRNCVVNIMKTSGNDKFIQFYTTEMKRVLEICDNDTLNIDLNLHDYIVSLTSQSCLRTLSEFVNLDNIEAYTSIKRILSSNEQLQGASQEIVSRQNKMKYSEIDVYNAYYILLLADKYIEMGVNNGVISDHVQVLLNSAKNYIMQSVNVDFQIYAMENLFAYVFQRSRDAEVGKIRRHIHYVASSIKSALKEIKNRFSGDTKKQESYLRLNNLLKYVTDFLWRLDLLKTQKDVSIDVMTSSPTSLVHICLQNDDYEKAHEVFKVFNIRDRKIQHKIDFMEKYEYLKRKEFDNNDNKIKTITDFFIENVSIDSEIDDALKYFEDAQIYLNLIDSTLTFSKNYETSDKIISAAKIYKPNYNNDYERFYDNIFKLFMEIGTKRNVSLLDIINNCRYPLTYDKYKEEETLINVICENVKSFLNTDDRCKYYLALSELLGNENNYLRKVYNYLTLLSQILTFQDVFKILTQNRAALLGELFFMQKIPPRELESLFSKLELDIVYNIAWNCIPTVNIEEKASSKIDYDVLKNKNFMEYLVQLKRIHKTKDIPKHKIYTPDFSLLSYIRRRNWLLAYLINKIHVVEEAKPDTNSDRTKYFNRLINLKRNQLLCHLYNGNVIVTALQKSLDKKLILDYVENFVKVSKQVDWMHLFEIVDNVQGDIYFGQLRNYVICNLITDKSNYGCVERITDTSLRLRCILENLKNWPGSFCLNILTTQLTHRGVEARSKEELQGWISKISLYEDIRRKWTEMGSWHEVYIKSNTHPKEVFLWLLKSSIDVSTLLSWIKVHQEALVDIFDLIDGKYFVSVFNENVEIDKIKILLDLLPFDHRVQICKDLLKHLRKLSYLQFVVDYLIDLLPELESDYINLKTSLVIMSCFHTSEHEYMWCLISRPLLIIEQLIMNTRLEKLNYVLEKVRKMEQKCDVTIESVNSLLRMYAEKSLAFRGIQPSIKKKAIELKLLQSLDTVSDDTNESNKKLFVFPQKVPDKSEWMPNEEANECMCCLVMTFSMFNRRHHCRRCGRVVCGNCSMKKLQITQYGDIPVRVCDDCFKTTDDTRSSIRSDYSTKSGSYICWVLTDDDRHNDIAREEFSYEYAPSVSLCLSILKLHTETVEYPRFLLNQCKKLLPHLQETVREIDYSFVIQMLKSLATAAKLISLNLSFKAELILCNNMLLQVELLGLLADRGCSELLSFSQGEKKYKLLEDPEEYYINSTMLRRLIDKLIELEHWNVALEVSTKAGLDKTRIFAAWGTSCIKSGAFQLARDKFQYCLERNMYYDPEMSVSMNTSTISDSRPLKTPPLVNEIILVLESKTYMTYSYNPTPPELNSSTLSLNASSTTPDLALSVLNKLKSLKDIINNVEIERNDSKIYLEPKIYNECLYYLFKYASHMTILKFYIRHEDLHEALNYLIENRLPTDAFIELYMTCVQDGNTNTLHTTMRDIDPNLYVWETYMRSICGFLEKNQMFNILYNLQLFMCDYIRAAMTCIKFYKQDATSFTELVDREYHLAEAQKHLKTELEQEQWVKVAPILERKLSTASSDSGNLPEKGFALRINPRNIDRHINTIWRQIEVVKFLAECEAENRPTIDVLKKIFYTSMESTPDTAEREFTVVPTLFDTNAEKIQLAVLSLVCGKNIEEGFGIAFRVIQDYHLKYQKIYSIAGTYFSQKFKETSIIELISCIRTSGLSDETVNTTCDDILTIAIHILMEANSSGGQREKLIKLISDPGVKINAYIECKQLKCAYLLAVQHNRNNDIRKILREAERLNQLQIKAICIKRLSQTQ